MRSKQHFITAMAGVILVMATLIPWQGRSQIVNSTTKKRISIGVGLFTDIWPQHPDGMDVRAINQGVNVLATYNFPFGKSNFSFAIGAGITIHNLFWNYRYQGDSLNFQFVKIEDTLGYKRSKLTMPYLEVPLEFRLKTNNKISVGVGFKLGYMVYAHAKWVGDDYLFQTNNTIRASFKGIENIQNFAYGPTLRIGYKWFNVAGYYSISSVFDKGKGPDMYPISVGFVLMPF